MQDAAFSSTHNGLYIEQLLSAGMAVLDVLQYADVLTTGVDAAATIQAQTMLKKMLAHLMAAAPSRRA